MAVSVGFYSEDHHVHDSLRRDIRRLKTGSDDLLTGRRLKSSIKALVGFWEQFRHTDATTSCLSALPPAPAFHIPHQSSQPKPRELFRPYQLVAIEQNVEAPPNYDECLLDLPPDYTCTNASATARISSKSDLAGGDTVDCCGGDLPTLQPDNDVYVSIDDKIYTCGKKQAKKAAKQAQKEKWAGSDDEEKKEDGAAGGEEGDGNGNGGDGADGGAGGAGGDPPDGGGDGGGDDGDDWFTGGGSKKKDKKKKKKNPFDDWEDEEKKKEEEETKKAEEESAAKGTGVADASAGNAEPVDDWGKCDDMVHHQK